MDLATFTFNEIELLQESCKIQDSQWNQRLGIVLEIFFHSVERFAKIPAIAENIILHCLSIIVNLCKVPVPEKQEQPKEKKEKKEKESKDKKKPESAEATPLSKSSKQESEPKSKTFHLNFLTCIAEESYLVVKAPAMDISALYDDFRDGKLTFENWWNKNESEMISEVETIAPRKLSKQEAREISISRKFFNRWRSRMSSRKSTQSRPHLAQFLEGSWLKKLLLLPSSQQIRSQIVALIRSLTSLSVQRTNLFIDLLAFSMLPEVSVAGNSFMFHL